MEKVLKVDDEASFDSPSESNPPFDIYIRLNGDEERDYCFQVKTDTTYGDLLEIYKTLPLNLSPSVFFEPMPSHFQLSTGPGILTREGGLLFGQEADKASNLKPMRNDDLISKTAWPGQLIIPAFPDRYFLKYAVIAGLAVWLYTDLPDFISPTPGICLSDQLCKGAIYVLNNTLDMPDKAESFAQSAFANYSPTSQVIFFLLHAIKVIVIFFMLWVGAYNPYTGKKRKIDREELVKIGWTSAKKATRWDFEQDYRNYQINNAGGILKASNSGLLSKIRRTTVQLGDGEGFQLPLDWESRSTSEMYPDDDNKFRLSYTFLKKQEEHFQDKYSKDTDTEYAQHYKHFRRYGPFDTSEELREIAEKRLHFDDGLVDKDSTPLDDKSALPYVSVDRSTIQPTEIDETKSADDAPADDAPTEPAKSADDTPAN